MDNINKLSKKENKYTPEDLKIMQNWSLERKIQVTQAKILEFCTKFDNKIYVLFFFIAYILDFREFTR